MLLVCYGSNSTQQESKLVVFGENEMQDWICKFSCLGIIW